METSKAAYLTFLAIFIFLNFPKKTAIFGLVILLAQDL